jgi:hypothetical protein
MRTPAVRVVMALAAALAWLSASPGVEAQIPLDGFQEIIPEGGAVFTGATGDISGSLSADGSTISYTLTYSFPSAPITQGAQYVNQAHLHFGQLHTTGGIIAFLCFSEAPPLPSAPAGTPPCPSPEGTVQGTLTAASVIGPGGQGINAGEFAKLLEAIGAGTVYANIHTDRFPGGEIRGQIGGSGN